MVVPDNYEFNLAPDLVRFLVQLLHLYNELSP